jgi:ankyrin repeat protein
MAKKYKQTRLSAVDAKLINAVREGDYVGMVIAMENGANVDAKDPKFGISALTIASIRGNLYNVDRLLQSGANPYVRDPVDNWTAIDYAEWFGRRSIADRLAVAMKQAVALRKDVPKAMLRD